MTFRRRRITCGRGVATAGLGVAAIVGSGRIKALMPAAIKARTLSVSRLGAELTSRMYHLRSSVAHKRSNAPNWIGTTARAFLTSSIAPGKLSQLRYPHLDRQLSSVSPSDGRGVRLAVLWLLPANQMRYSLVGLINKVAWWSSGTRIVPSTSTL